ncbi:alpha-galactosidase [Dysgonomonas sp. 216]|uniref:alpha-galactosidase n=1 Tax=Dysgonomonas sp. 216 TaxID=2302934 RepID=UPI0013D4274B|nr:alpha-galactosidase [Dysgonomonas sp. 216]NDW17616.1 alpha-galactosidase [Dysgonomonas sp. 216]
MKNLLTTVLFSFLTLSSVLSNEKEIVRVETNDLSMIFTAETDGKIVYHYWGEKVNNITPVLDRRFKNQPDTNDELVPQLYPAYGGRYYLNPALKLTHEDGVLTTDLVYVGSKTKVLDSNRTETVISLKDKIYPVFVDVKFIAFRAENIISQSVSITHQEKKGIQVENIASAYIPLHAESYYLTHFNGTWAAEMQMEEEMLTHGVKVIESKKGVRTTQSENPSFILSLNAKAQEDSGDVYAGCLAWSGNYKLSFELDETGSLNILGGMNPFAALYNLKASEKIETPEMILTYSNRGKGQITRNFHDWARKYSLAHGDELRPILLNSWEGAYFSFNEKTLTDMMDDAAGFGVEMFVLDDGWFGNKYPRNGDNAGLGDWQVNKTKLPRGINYLADYAVNKGLKFGIWIEPEMVNPDSELAKKHPEWIVKSGKRDILPMRNQWLLDLSNPKVQDFVFNTFDEVLAMSSNISYVKWDANRHVDNAGSDYLAKNEQSHFWYEYVKGLYSVYDRIRAKYPDVMIQLCSSGGGRLDYGALKYHDEFWASDNTNALDRIYIQYATNTFFPAIATGSHVSTSPNHQTGMIIPIKFRFDVAMSGRLGLELQPKDIVGDDHGFAKKAIETYKQIRPIVQFGDLYRLVSPYDVNSWASHMYVSKDKKQSVFFAYSLKYHGRTTYFDTRLKGLNPDKNYKVTEINSRSGHSSFNGNGKVFSGDYLMKIGVNLNIGNPFDSAVLLITEQ